MRKETREVYKKAYALWPRAQFMMAIEESSELIKAVCKFWRKPSDDSSDRLLEEIVDAKIMVEQLEVMLNCEEKAKIRRRRKLRRLKKLIAEAKE